MSILIKSAANTATGVSFGVDLLSGEPTGYFYAATYTTLFQIIDGYVRTTGTAEFTAFLNSSQSEFNERKKKKRMYRFVFCLCVSTRLQATSRSWNRM